MRVGCSESGRSGSVFSSIPDGALEQRRRRRGRHSTAEQSPANPQIAQQRSTPMPGDFTHERVYPRADVRNMRPVQSTPVRRLPNDRSPATSQFSWESFAMSRWRVVALRVNGERRILDEYITREAAERLREMLRTRALFPAVFVELDEDSDSEFSRTLLSAVA